MSNSFHSVKLDTNKCCGCTNCLKRCPTEAIRIHNGKATISPERCIDCGECIRICPHHAKQADSTPLEEIEKYKIKVALPAPSLFGQFHNLDDLDIVLSGLQEVGFDYIFEVSRAAELISEVTRKLMAENKLKTPVISSACPAIVRLIKIRFPELCDNVLPTLAPMETAAILARKDIKAKTGCSDDDIGVFFITPCPAKISEVFSPVLGYKSACNGAIAISKIYPLLTSKMDKLKIVEPIGKSGLIGVGWASSGGESSGMLSSRYLAADGMENVTRVLEELEDDRITNVDFVELNACSGGCVGGVLTVENPYVAQARIQNLKKYLPVSLNHIDDTVDINDLVTDRKVDFDPKIFRLSDDINEALSMMEDMEKIEKSLPGLDCGSCGSPTCKALAEDIVRGKAKETDCIFKLRKQIQKVYDQLKDTI